MKRAGIVTYFNSYSIGACLQAYATKEFFSELGYNAQFVPYVNKYEQASKDAFRAGDGIKATVKSLVKNYLYRGASCMKKAYESESCFYQCPDDLTSCIDVLGDEYWDVLVSGSDQIWNPQISGGIERAHFLGFGNSPKRVALASSAGSHVFSEDELSEILPYLSNFDLITVREKHLREQIEGKVPAPVSVCPDPTLLYDGEWWRNRSAEHQVKDWGQFSGDKYILTYFMGKGFHEYHPMIEKYTAELDLPVWNIQFNEWEREGVDKTISSASPVDFISLVDNASVVISDSFHGVAFSVNLNTPLIAINNVRNPVRVRELLQNCSLERLIEPGTFASVGSFDYSGANDYLGSERIAVRNLMKRSLE